jgi:signal transduction histidine kinase/ActR/RegA family two-component response regulator
VNYDITERNAAEEELRFRTAFFEAQVDSALDGILVVDSAGEKMLQNRRLGEVWKVPQEILDDPDDAKQMRFVTDRTKNPKQYAEKVAYLYSHPTEISRDVIELVDGTVLDRYSAPVRDPQGRHYGRIWTFRDITDQRRLEEQLRQSQKMEAIGRLSGGVAHDFNNLLAVIMGYVGLLEVKGQVSPEIAGSIHHISEAADRAANLVRQLLTFSRKQVMQLSEHNLNGLVINLAKMLRRLLSANIEMQVDCAPAPLSIRADEGMVEQVLLNLVVNARDAMPKGGVLRIATKPVDLDEPAARAIVQARPGAYACLIVSDTGTGIAPEILSRIFEPFFTTKGEGEGTGLGLATAYGIMQQHEGWINVESEAGRGTTFLAYFPRLAVAEIVKPAARLAAVMRGGHEGILLVEDDSGVRKLAEVALTRLGYRVFSAYNGSDALQVWQAQKQQIELLLTDMVLPDRMTGRELALRLRSDNPRLPIIYMSGYKAENTAGGVQLREDTNYLAKPFDVVGLAKIVRASLDRGATQAPFASPPG